MSHATLKLALLPLVLLCLSSCAKRTSSSQSPNARPEVASTLRQDLASPRHPSDGGGRAWLEPDPDGRDLVSAGSLGRWTLLYEAGSLGIVEDGMVFLQVSPFWGWSTPQVHDSQQPGFTEVLFEGDEPGLIELEALTLDHQLLGIRIKGRALASGERIRLVYGAGELGARADRYAESGSRFWFAVDGNGDGIRRIVADSPLTPVRAGPAAGYWLTLPSTSTVKQDIPLVVSVLDNAGNAVDGYVGTVELSAVDSGLDFVPKVEFSNDNAGSQRQVARAVEQGVYRIEAEGPDGLIGRSNPILVSDDTPPILWGDLHGHSAYSDGTGTPEDYFSYARDIAVLDVVALTDHDHWGVRPLSQHPAIWDDIKSHAQTFHEPGRFVTLLGYEWTSWIHGHRHVLYFGDEGEVFSSIDPAFEHPEQLWAALRGKDAMTITHHSAGGPVATNWDIAPDPELEPVTEIVSVHGSSEAPDSPGLIYRSVSGNFARDALNRGYKLGFIGSGDSHDGHPGLAQIASGNGGLVAILATEHTRKGIMKALQTRRTYATNGTRIILLATLNGAPIGSTLGSHNPPYDLLVQVIGTAPVERVELIRNGDIAATIRGESKDLIHLEHSFENFGDGDYVYIRVIQVDGGAAWSSPFFFES